MKPKLSFKKMWKAIPMMVKFLFIVVLITLVTICLGCCAFMWTNYAGPRTVGCLINVPKALVNDLILIPPEIQ